MNKSSTIQKGRIPEVGEKTENNLWASAESVTSPGPFPTWFNVL